MGECRPSKQSYGRLQEMRLNYCLSLCITMSSSEKISMPVETKVEPVPPPPRSIFTLIRDLLSENLECHKSEQLPARVANINSSLESDKLQLFKMDDNIKPVKFRLHRKWHFTLPLSVGLFSLIVSVAVFSWTLVQMQSLNQKMESVCRSFEDSGTAKQLGNRGRHLPESEYYKYRPIENPSTESPDKEIEENPLNNTGTTYIHWGKPTCQGDATLVYSGFGAGAPSMVTKITGGGAEFLCMPLDPEWNRFDMTNDTKAHSFLYSVQHAAGQVLDKDMHEVNILCSVCLAPRSTQLMIPAKRTCPSSWTREYEGYLMSSYLTDLRSSYVCMDAFPEGENETKTLDAGAKLYPVSGYCNNKTRGPTGGLTHCPPYHTARELTCVVCTI